nr:MAG: hypothetical protein [uncultured archaeon]
MSENDELTKLERRASGTMLYLSLLETFTKFEMFTNSQKIVEVLCGTLEVFLKNMLKNTPEDDRVDNKTLIIKGFEELIFRLKEFV